jgi:hypothetical protein
MHNSMFAIAVSILLVSMTSGVSTAGSEDGPVIGYWGDRSGIHPNSNPPVRWDYDTGLNTAPRSTPRR